MRVQRAFEQPLRTSLMSLTLLVVALATVMGLLAFTVAEAQSAQSARAATVPATAAAAAAAAAEVASKIATPVVLSQNVEGQGNVTFAEQSRIFFHRGHSVQHAFGRSWLVYGFPNGVWHATTKFHKNSKGQTISSVPGYVPSWLGPYKHRAASARVQGSGSVAVRSGVTGIAFARGQVLRGDNAGGISDGYRAGQCTEGAFMLAAHVMRWMGNAKDWDNTARARHLPVGYTPRIGATVVFEPGVAGASWAYGHVAHVVGVSGSRFLIKEMNGTAGAFRFDLRWVSMQRGVSFIYY